MRMNVTATMTGLRTHEGGQAVHITPIQQLRRSVLSCLLWEREFYEDGQEIAKRIADVAKTVPPAAVASLAIEARSKFHLRHAPLLLAAVLAQSAAGTSLVSETIRDVIQRADELAEFVAIYAHVNGVAPSAVKPKLSNQVRKGLAMAFGKFDAYALAKYDRGGAVKLRDVLFLCHAKPKDDAQALLWKRLIDGTLESPDTWEVALSGGANKRETFERLIRENNLGYLALLRNLRNMQEAGCDGALVRDAILARKGAGRVLPFRYVAAARAAPMFEPELDRALSEAVDEWTALRGTTFVLVDVSGSMANKLSARSDLTRMDAAAALASIIPAERLRMFSFSNKVVEVPPRRGMAGVEAIIRSQAHSGTRMWDAVKAVSQFPHDRLIVITDEQTEGVPIAPSCQHAYMINVASARNGVGYGRWTHLDGFSEQVIRWIVEYEGEGEVT